MRKRLPAYSYIEIALTGRTSERAAYTEALRFFADRGFDGSHPATFHFKGRFKVAVYTRSPAKVSSLRRDFRCLRGSGLRCKTKVLHREDWFDKWQKGYRPTPLGRRFIAVPVPAKRKKIDKRIPIYLDPKGAFGSGMHETTQLMVRVMEQLGGKFESFLDVGIGTGVLSVVAVRLGATRVAGLDHDAASVTSARYNLKLNACKPAFIRRLDIGALKAVPRFDLVGANLLSSTLTAARRKLERLIGKGKYLAVSGILLRNLKGFRRDFASPSLRCLKTFRGRQWCAILYRRK
ncbi:MAG: 50S ribosomal protein L11 methyltransferase [Candidatus Omnitrophota bacterium]|nr:50S ribosomal protein L11 methyltransferase [Candidatus Omnitrophota bacterium]